MCHGFAADGGVELNGITIEGFLACDDGHFIGKSNRPALDIKLANIGATVFLRLGFKAEGGVMVNSTTVEGDLVCSEGHFVAGENPTALNVNGAIIKGSVFLRDNFKAEGLVSLQSASIRGSLNCHAGQFISKNNDAAFDAYNAKIGGTVSMCHGFKAEGGVRLSDTAIGEDLRCLGGQFIAKEGAPAIDAVRLKVEGGIFFGEKSVTVGEARFSHVEASRSFEWLDVQSPEQAVLNLNFSRTGRLLNCREAWSNIGNLILDGFVYEQLDDRAPQTATIQIEWPPRNQLRRHRRLLRLRSRRRID